MTESKVQLLERWRREGRAEEVARYRDEVRQKLRAEGGTRMQAKEGSWEAARAEFPPLASAENQPESRAIRQTTEPAVQGGFSGDEKDWVWGWFGCMRAVAKWQKDSGVTLSDDGLRELLRLLGFHTAWAFLLGARGDRPPGADCSTGDSLARVAALIDITFQEIAEAITPEDLATFTLPNSGGCDTMPA